MRILPEIVGKSRRGNNLYSINPFLTDFTIRVKKRHLTIAKGQHVVIDPDGNEVAEAAIVQIHEVDNAEFIKIYTLNMKSFFDLSKTASRVLAVLFRTMQKGCIGKDQIYFAYKEANLVHQELTEGEELSKTIYMRGINELMKKEFIAESPRGVGIYYLNPNLIFNGDRLRFVTEYRKTESFKEAEERFLHATKHL